MEIKYKSVKVLTCPYCSLEWTPLVEKPKWCPSCKRLLDKLPSRPRRRRL